MGKFSNETLVYGPVGTWGGVALPEPSYPGAYLAADQKDKLARLYAATHLNITDDLKALIGANCINLSSKGYSYGVQEPRNESAASPYAGLVYDVTPNVSLYGSYTDIFNPQSEVDSTNHTLPAAHGLSLEGGVKSEWFDKRLYATASVFKSEQDGLADFAGTFPDGRSYYTGLDTFVTGYEFELAGNISDNWSVSGGWTQLWIEGPHGVDARTYLPRKTLKLSSTYSIPELNDLKLGAALRWQGETSIQDIVVLRQGSYAVADLMASIRIVKGLRAQLNIRNVADQKYLGSLEWNEAFYAAPRSVQVSRNYAL